MLALPKGHPDAGETPEEAATREVREETGVEGRRAASTLGDVALLLPARRQAAAARRSTFYLFEYLSGDVADHDHEVEEALLDAARGGRAARSPTPASGRWSSARWPRPLDG